MNLDLEGIFQVLDEEGYIQYGKEIPLEVLERVFDLTYDSVPKNKPWQWMNPLLDLKTYLDEQGYFCVTRNSGQLLHIHEAEYIEYKLLRNRKNEMKRKKRTIQGLACIDKSFLNKNDRLKLDRAKEIFIMDLAGMKSILNKNYCED